MTFSRRTKGTTTASALRWSLAALRDGPGPFESPAPRGRVLRGPTVPERAPRVDPADRACPDPHRGRRRPAPRGPHAPLRREGLSGPLRRRLPGGAAETARDRADARRGGGRAGTGLHDDPPGGEHGQRRRDRALPAPRISRGRGPARLLLLGGRCTRHAQGDRRGRDSVGERPEYIILILLYKYPDSFSQDLGEGKA